MELTVAVPDLVCTDVFVEVIGEKFLVDSVSLSVGRSTIVEIEFS